MFFILHAGCEINQKEFKPQDEFVKIYNDADEALTWYPVGIIQTTDKGFLILNAVKSDTSVIEYPTASIIKINAFGEVVNTAATTWLAPAPGLINVGGNYAFVAMDAQNKASLVYVNPDNAEPTETVDLDITMPLSCINDEQGRSVILGYDYISRNSIVAVYNSSTALINKSELNVKEDMMAQVQYHMNKTGSDLPFFIGEWQNDSQKGYFVNCLANYTLRTIFFDENVTPVGGDIFSFQDRDALSSLINLNGNNYAFTRYYGGNNYISTNVEVDPTSSQNFNDLVQNKLTELIPNAKVTGKKVVFSDTEYLLFASTTNSNSIVIYQYTAEGSEEPVRTKYFDFENKIEVVDMIQDINDEGIVVLARTYLTGKYLRPIVMKFKKSDFVN
jgi:hypothetical protein